jgi:hypothetical protein
MFRIRLFSMASLLLILVIACTPSSEPATSESPESLSEPIAAAVVPTQVSTPTPLPVPTSTPEATATVVPSATPTLVPTATSTPLPTSTPAPTAIPAPVNVPAALIYSVEWLFPESITFNAEIEHVVDIEHAELIIYYEQVRQCADLNVMSVRIKPPDNLEDPYTWDWEMKKTGSIPPGTTVLFGWQIVDVNGALQTFESDSIEWSDDRFEWDQYTENNLTIEWYAGGEEFGQKVYDRVMVDIDRLEIGATVSTPIKALIYDDASSLQEAVLYAQAWTGGLAFTNQNVVLIAIDPTSFETQVSGLTHEIAHLIVAQESDSCIGDIPRWLSEGLATYSEGPITSAYQAAIDDAVAAETLITIRTLSSSFPADHSRASLSYAQSVSLVTYLIDTYGWQKMTELLAIFKSGSTYDGALLEVYEIDRADLDAAWRVWLVAG